MSGVKTKASHTLICDGPTCEKGTAYGDKTWLVLSVDGGFIRAANCDMSLYPYQDFCSPKCLCMAMEQDAKRALEGEEA